MESAVQAFTSWIAFGPNIAAIIVIGVVSGAIKRGVLGTREERKNSVPYTGWREVYNSVYKIQAIALGALIGMIPGAPIPEAFQGDGLGGSILNYMGTGAAAMIVYTALVSNANAYIDNMKLKGGVR